MPQPQRIIFDLTTSARWRGPGAVGIVQTERELARHAPGVAEQRVEFSLYSMESKQYFVVRSDVVSDILDGNVRVRFRSGPAASKPPLATRAGWILSNPRRYIRLKLPQAWAVGNEETHGLDDSTETDRQRLIPFTSAVDGPLQLLESDLLISCGADWHGKDLEAIREDKRQSGFQYASLCYDIIPWKHPNYWPPGVAESVVAYHAEAAWLTDLVMCISRTTAREFYAFCRDLDIPSPKVGVFRLGDRKATTQYGGSLPYALDESRFILMVASLEPRKNHRLIYNVFDDLVRADALPADVRLVFAGAGRWMTDDLLLEIELNKAVRGRIIILGQVDDGELARLYARCLFTVYPSFHEGWGLPVVESLSYGKICVASTRGSLPEVSDKTHLIDPHDFYGWRDAVVKYVTDESARSHLEARIRRDFVPWSWEQAATQFFRTITSSLKAH